MQNKRTMVKKEEILANDYNLSLNRYKEIVHEHIEHVQPQKLISELKTMENEIQLRVRFFGGRVLFKAYM